MEWMEEEFVTTFVSTGYHDKQFNFFQGLISGLHGSTRSKAQSVHSLTCTAAMEGSVASPRTTHVCGIVVEVR